MPLSKPATRQHIHTRNIQCLGFEREDGLWDIEARLTDTKTYSFANLDRGGINAGEAVHDMSIRITLDNDLKIIEIEVVTDAAPFSICPEVTPSFQKLVGETIGTGWRRTVLGLFGKDKGCTHIVTLLTGQLAHTAHQTIHQARNRRHGQDGDKNRPNVPAKTTSGKPSILDTCHALKSDGPVVARHWPDFHEKK